MKVLLSWLIDKLMRLLCLRVTNADSSWLVCSQGLLEMEFALPTDSTETSGLSLLRRLWVAKFDVEEEGRALAEKYVLWGFLLLLATTVFTFLQKINQWSSTRGS